MPEAVPFWSHFPREFHGHNYWDNTDEFPSIREFLDDWGGYLNEANIFFLWGFLGEEEDGDAQITTVCYQKNKARIVNVTICDPANSTVSDRMELREFVSKSRTLLNAQWKTIDDVCLGG